MHGEELIGIKILISGPLGENKYGYTLLFKLDRLKYYLQPLLGAAPVEELALKKYHPDIEKGNLQHGLLGYDGGRAFAEGISDDYIENAPVIAHVEQSLVSRYLFPAPDVQLNATEEPHRPEAPHYHGIGQLISCFAVEPSDDPVSQHKRHCKYQEKSYIYGYD